jgi:hypothetical protein
LNKLNSVYIDWRPCFILMTFWMAFACSERQWKNAMQCKEDNWRRRRWYAVVARKDVVDCKQFFTKQNWQIIADFMLYYVTQISTFNCSLLVSLSITIFNNSSADK